MSGRDPHESDRPEEPARDQEESAFTPILREVYESDPRVLFVVFVDPEGECIDYVSALDPFEAKVAAAHCMVLLGCARESREKLPVGEAHTIELSTDERELWMRRVTDEYVVVVQMRVGVDRACVQHALLSAARAFRREVGMGLPAWERPSLPAGAAGLRVSLRPAVGWGYAPSAFSDCDDDCEISDVLGRWTDSDAECLCVCFRVRTTDGRELTLIHDVSSDAWSKSR